MDYKGDIQICVKRDDIGEESYAQFKTLDIGDIIGVVGRVFKTRTGEISIHAERVELLSKSLRPLPEKFHGLKDPELRYRQRFVDLIVNPEVRDTFVKRSIIISEMRSWLNSRGFIEVETRTQYYRFRRLRAALYNPPQYAGYRYVHAYSYRAASEDVHSGRP